METAIMYPNELYSFCKSIPKIELHTHIHGCLRPATLRELVQQDPDLVNENAWLFSTDLGDGKVLQQQAFAIFSLIHKVITTKERLVRIVKECIEDFAHDNVKYLELRSTPRILDDTDTIEDYLVTVMEAIHQVSKQYDIEVRLILSINRTHSVQNAQDTLQLALKYCANTGAPRGTNNHMIVGLDFSGNPSIQNAQFSKFESIFKQARQAQLKITLHFAEIYDPQDTDDILAFGPDRVGHACCLSPGQWQQLQEKQIPIEICFTSNIITRPELHSHCVCCMKKVQVKTIDNTSTTQRSRLHEHIISQIFEERVSSSSAAAAAASTKCPQFCRMCSFHSVDEMLYSRQVYDSLDCLCGYTVHPLRTLCQQKPSSVMNSYHPICICTDDPGVFATSSSLEYYRITMACQLSKQHILQMAESSILMIFDTTMIEQLQRQLNAFQQSNSIDELLAN